jgi:hypothetical protein
LKCHSRNLFDEYAFVFVNRPMDVDS